MRVEWLQAALDELSECWMQADAAGRGAITAATHAIDQKLRVDPYGEGESREDAERDVRRAAGDRIRAG